MFAVPGWSVSASALVREQVRSKKSDSNSKDGAHKSKKRKHDEDDAANESELDSPTQEPPNDLDESTKSTKKYKKSGSSHGRDQQEVVETSELVAAPVVNGSQRSAVNDLPRKKNDKHREQQRNHEKQDQRHSKVGPNEETLSARPPVVDRATLLQPVAKLTPLQAKMRSKLTSARFRHLNETLYTTSSADALKLFTSSPELFVDYHAGFAQQVKDSWPQNPVEGYVKSIRVRGALSDVKDGVTPLPRRKTGSCTIADLGCGDAPLARGCQSVVKNLKLKFHNYDLHPANSFVTKGDIANLPLRDGEVDIAVFCLSLMGTNWIDFVEEAWRILRGDGKGEIWVAEVKSRFGRVIKGRVVDNSVGKRRKPQKPKAGNEDDEYDGPTHFVEDERAPPEQDDETDITAFVKVFTRRGFQLREGSVNKRNKMFVSMIFVKSGIPTAGKHKGLKWTGREYQKQQDSKPKLGGGFKKDEDEITTEQEGKALKPCVYKTR